MPAPNSAGRSSHDALTAVSLLWAVAILLVPRAHETALAFYVTSTLLVVNTIASLRLLTTTRRIPVLLNAVQLALFGLLSYQFASTYGADHYRYDHPPRWFDWVEFLAESPTTRSATKSPNSGSSWATRSHRMISG